METVTDFIFLVSKMTADGDCSHEIKRHLQTSQGTTENAFNFLCSRVASPKHAWLSMQFSTHSRKLAEDARGCVLDVLPENVHRQPPGHVCRRRGGA